MDIISFIIALSSFPFVFTNAFGFRIIGLTGSIASGKSTTTRILKNLGIPVIDFDYIAREVVNPGSSCLSNIVKEFGNEVLLPNGELNRARLGQMIFSDQSKREKLNSIMKKPLLFRFLYLLLQFFLLGTIPSSFTSKYIKSLQMNMFSQPDPKDKKTTNTQQDNTDNQSLEHSIPIACQDVLNASHGVCTDDLYPGLLQGFHATRILVIDAPLLFEYNLDKICSHILYIDCDRDLQISRLMRRDNCTQQEAQNKINSQWSVDKKKKLSNTILYNNYDGYDKLYDQITAWWVKTTRIEFGLALVSPLPFNNVLKHYFDRQDNARKIAQEYLEADKIAIETFNNKKGQSPTPPTVALIGRAEVYPMMFTLIDMNTKPSWWEEHNPLNYCLKPTTASILFTLLLAIPTFFLINYLDGWMFPN